MHPLPRVPQVRELAVDEPDTTPIQSTSTAPTPTIPPPSRLSTQDRASSARGSPPAPRATGAAPTRRQRGRSRAHAWAGDSTRERRGSSSDGNLHLRIRNWEFATNSLVLVAQDFSPAEEAGLKACTTSTTDQRVRGFRAGPTREAPTDLRRTLALTKRCAPLTRSRSARHEFVTAGREHTGSSSSVLSGSRCQGRPR